MYWLLDLWLLYIYIYIYIYIAYNNVIILYEITYLSITGIKFKQIRQENNTFGTWREMRLCATTVDARIYNARLKWKNQVRQKVCLTMRTHYRTRTKSKHVLPPRIFLATGRYMLMITCIQHPNFCMKSKRSGTWLRKEVLYRDLNMQCRNLIQFFAIWKSIFNTSDYSN